MALKYIDHYGPLPNATSSYPSNDRLRFPSSTGQINFAAAQSPYPGRVLKCTSDPFSSGTPSGSPFLNIAPEMAVSGNDIVIGFGFYIDQLTNASNDPSPFFCFTDVSGNQKTGCRFTAAGYLQWCDAGTTAVLATSLTPFLVGVRYYAEVKLHRGGTGIDAMTLKINGTTVFDTITPTFGSNIVDFVPFWSQDAGNSILRLFRSHISFWPFSIVDATAGEQQDFMGEIETEIFYPTSETVGQVTGFTRTGGTNVSDSVGSGSLDDDTTYYGADAVSDKAVFDSTDVLTTVPESIKGVRVITVTRKDGLGDRTAKQIIRSGGTNYEGDEQALGNDFQATGHVWEKNPNGDVAWSLSSVEAASFGFKIET